MFAMKVLIVSPYPFPGNPIKGGVEAVTSNLVKGLSHFLDVQVLVLSFMHTADRDLRVADNIVVRYVKQKYRSIKVELKKNAADVLLETNESWQPDIIHVEGNGSNLLLYHPSYASKLVYTQHGVLSAERKAYKSVRSKVNFLLSELIENRYKRKVHNWIFISNYNKSLNQDLINSGVNAKLIYNPVNPEYYDVSLPFFNKNNIYYVGSITERKGLHILLEAIYKVKHRDIHANVIGGFGNDVYEKKINYLINQTSISDKVVFHGWKTSSEIQDIIRDDSFMILPSYQETLPVVIAEAMAMGKIVIATNICGIPEMVIDNETGLLFEPGNSDALAELLDKVTKMPKPQLVAMSHKAKERALSLYSPKRVAKEHINFYSSVISKTIKI